MGPLRAAGWWILDYAYALVWQTRALFDRTDPASYTTGTRDPVIILPGIYETWKFMQPIVEELHNRGHPVHVLEMLERNLHPVAEMADLVTEYLRRNRMRDVTLVAHSKGGLAGKLVMIGTAGDQVRGMVAVATPFGGSRYARMIPSRTLRALAPMDPVILTLGRELATNRKIVSIYARFDPHIPEGSELSGATNIRVNTGGHFLILAHPRVIEELGTLSGRSSPDDPTCMDGMD
ncbi:triacylglycerol lipase [Microbacterium sp. AK031]|uniref:esterase/lipase family protein n=1 Tax=Microbacterium sp. AK031 TaxID=2723076 RepID=UPI0021672951|nr:alpha/beta hydrolase [Microbacterium sp. AK031]MCS3842501.1 hypothetical protein [Microbacterium sp. AK031]